MTPRLAGCKRFTIPLLAVLLAACKFSLAADVTPPPGYQPPPEAIEPVEVTSGPVYPLVAPDPERGRAIYSEKCSPCHGESGLGDGPRAAQLPNPVAPLGDEQTIRKVLPAQWFRTITQGNLEKFMPPFLSLTDSQRWDVVAYVLSFGSAAGSLSDGAGLYSANCVGCHGIEGKGDGPDAKGQKMVDFTNQEYMAQKSLEDLYLAISNGVESAMPAYAESLSETGRWNLAKYLRSLSFIRAKVEVKPTDEPTSALTPTIQLEPTQTVFAPATITSTGVLTSAEPVSPPISPTIGTLPPVTLTLSVTETQVVSTTPVVANTPEVVPTPTFTPAEPVSPTTALTETAPVSGAVALGEVTGLLINKSGTEIPVGITVTLHVFEGMQVVITDTTTTAVDGTYLFPDLEFAENRMFLVTAEFQGLTYGSEVGVVEKGITSLELPVEIYETTTDTTGLVIDRLHFFFEFIDKSTVRVVELYIISNPGTKTVVAGQEGKPVIYYSLPPGATNLEFQEEDMSDRFVVNPDGFGDLLPVRPGSGEHQLLFSYQMPYSKKLELARPVNLNTSAVIILVPDGSVKVRGEGILDGGMRDVQGVQYHLYNGGGYSAGQSINLIITGNPSGGLPTLSKGSTTSLLVGLGALGFVLILAGIWLYRRYQPAKFEKLEEGEGLEEAGDDTQESVMDAILALDDLYQEGQLNEEAYRQRRAELKGRLAELMGK